ncbi:MAG: hemerythrin family protein [Magnetospirillum sp. WYHS-4]
MALLEWKTEYRTGFASVDYEHETLINLINELYGKIEAGCSGDEVRRYLGEIDGLIEAHFALEEKVMRDIRYDRYAAHKADHDHLLEQIREIIEDVGDGQAPGLRTSLGQRLTSWFGRHFATEDKSLHNKTDGRHH